MTTTPATLVTTRNQSPHPPANGQSQQSQAALARWAAESAETAALEKHFKDIPLDDGLELLARMRRNCEIAARILEAKRTADDNLRCKTCDKSMEELHKEGKPLRDWRMRRPRRDNSTGTIYVEVFCSDVCIALENKVTHGIAAVSDQGVDATKRSVIAHQEKIQQEARKKKQQREQRRKRQQGQES